MSILIHKKYSKAFTIVELLVVIVVIGILAAITIVSYSGITTRAKVVSLKSDLSNAAIQLKMFNTDNSQFPATISTNCATNPTTTTNLCLKTSAGNDFTTTPYVRPTPQSFTLTATNGSLVYYITENSNPAQVASLTCPTGFIVVPGSATYGTSDFCTMKYEAKADDNGDGIGDTNQTTGWNTWPADTYPISASRKLVSSAAGYPVANISQTTATTAASAANFVYGCDSGCHIITEAEWMTIAQNVLSVASNWSGGAVGGGYIYSGHNDSAPNTALVADASDANGYAGTGQSSPSGQRRTLTLTNGEVIWDLAGNVWEWTSGQMTGGQPAGMASLNWYQWTAVSGGTIAVNPYPSGTGLSGSNSWNSTNGIGQIYGLTGDASLRGFIRGGTWSIVNGAGVLALGLGDAPSLSGSYFGFRVSR